MAKGRGRKPVEGAAPKGRQPVTAVPQAGASRRQPVETPAGAERLTKMRFRFDKVDVEGPWCPTKITPEDHALLLRKLGTLETMTAFEVFSQSPGAHGLGSDYSNVDECPNPAMPRRLKDLGLYDQIDGISRLRLDGRKRLYGLRRGNEFSILWWDPQHEIWPSRKR